MREGPLAALFRKTEEEGVEPKEAEATPPPAPSPEPPRGEESRAEEPPAAPPGPRDRLRHVFSSEIPEN
ncbi:MAG: cell division protein FtsZ, partial [Actinomycetota bacterium]|nr:cell division protein FtsZ [Actinomycetota bacterium]